MPLLEKVGKQIFWKSYFRIYDKLCDMGPYRKLLSRGVELLKPRSGGNYLDVASGTGNSTVAIWGRLRAIGGGEVTGIDSSTYGLAAAKEKYPPLEFPGLKFIFGDVDYPLPFETASLDGAFANNAMYLVRDPLLTLSEIHRVLRPGARFVMSNPVPQASPLEIIFEDARMRFREALGDYSVVSSGVIAASRFGKKFLVLLEFLPFQIALKRGAGGASNFIGETQWRKIIADLAESGHKFEIEAVEEAYAGQNTLFAMVRQ